MQKITLEIAFIVFELALQSIDIVLSTQFLIFKQSWQPYPAWYVISCVYTVPLCGTLYIHLQLFGGADRRCQGSRSVQK